jgi:hypothetical protein
MRLAPTRIAMVVVAVTAFPAAAGAQSPSARETAEHCRRMVERTQKMVERHAPAKVRKRLRGQLAAQKSRQEALCRRVSPSVETSECVIRADSLAEVVSCQVPLGAGAKLPGLAEQKSLEGVELPDPPPELIEVMKRIESGEWKVPPGFEKYYRLLKERIKIPDRGRPRR